jgi:tetratricopeptide (TPR) repeat protein
LITMSELQQSPVVTSLLLVKAQDLARRGRLKEAQAVLAPESSVIPEDPLVLQALAALVTAGGDYLRALRLWNLLLQREPGHAEAKRMISALELWINRPAWYRYIPYAGGALAAAAAVWLLLWALAEPPAPPSRATAPISVPAPAVQRSAPTRPDSVPVVSFPAPAKSSTTKRR